LRTSLLLSLAIAVFIYFSLHISLITDNNGAKYYLRHNTSIQVVSRELSQQHIINHPWLFLVTAYVYGAPHHLKTGEYFFAKGTHVLKLLKQITTGKGLYYYSLTIVPGWSFTQVKQALLQAEPLQHSLQTVPDVEMMQHLGYAKVNPEGQFYPETYFFVRDSTDAALLQRAHNLMEYKLNQLWQQRVLTVPYHTPYEALIAASLVEKEAKIKGEEPKIAGVLQNRLQRKMLLQFDPTIVYGLGDKFDGTIHKSDLLKDTPYNTYLHRNLPPTPIAMPGLEAIQAVLHPEQHDYLYFVAKGDGSHQFSKTLMEHHAAVAEVKKLLCQPRT